MTLDQLLYGVFPYVAIIVAIGTGIIMVPVIIGNIKFRRKPANHTRIVYLKTTIRCSIKKIIYAVVVVKK